MRNYSPTWDCWAFQGNNFLVYNRKKNIGKHISVVAIISAQNCRNTIIEIDKILSQASWGLTNQRAEPHHLFLGAYDHILELSGPV